ncbi:methyltransferase [Salix suchowensis]|nr:methyltransferase [Salix suchowensis]
MVMLMSPLVSFLYERGWRQSFNQSGFPGPAEEKFVKSGAYSKVIALDFSEKMLRQCCDYIKQDNNISTINLGLVRADVSRLPFASGSVDAVHAGAAMHCWPSPSNAVAEICRVLRNGGVFVRTTFHRYSSSTPWIERPFRERISRNFNFFTEEEIEDLCSTCGLTNYSKESSANIHNVLCSEAMKQDLVHLETFLPRLGFDISGVGLVYKMFQLYRHFK